VGWWRVVAITPPRSSHERPRRARATRLFDAYKRWTPAFEALPKEEVYTSLNVDITSAVTLVTGAIKEILPLRSSVSSGRTLVRAST